MAKTKPVASMTGFARQEGGDGAIAWTWEIKSVNGKSLDLRCRLPAGYEALEPVVRGRVPERCARGNLQINLSVNTSEQPLRMRVNQELLDQLLALAKTLEDTAGAAPPRLDGLLALRGVVEAVEEEETPDARAAREAAMAVGETSGQAGSPRKVVSSASRPAGAPAVEPEAQPLIKEADPELEKLLDEEEAIARRTAQGEGHETPHFRGED